MVKKLDAYFTPEAAMMIPFLILVSMVFMYMLVHAYDRALMVQDVNSLITLVRDEKNIDYYEEICKKEFEEIKEEHPYIAVDNLSLFFSQNEKSKPTIGIKADWDVPIWNGFSKTISYEKEVYKVRPLFMMYHTKMVREITENNDDADSDDVRDE